MQQGSSVEDAARKGVSSSNRKGSFPRFVQPEQGVTGRRSGSGGSRVKWARMVNGWYQRQASAEPTSGDDSDKDAPLRQEVRTRT